MPARILVAEDLAPTRLLLTTLLRRRGFEVREADNGLTALAALAGRPADLVLPDIEMPKMNGLVLLAR
jgi:CheY-like chemotaxis protein